MTNDDSIKRFGDSWDSRSTRQSYVVLGIWFLRGFIRRIFFKKSKGLVLIASKVKIRSSHKLSVGKNFLMETGCELNCNALHGMHFGDKVTIGAYALVRPSNIYGGAVGEGLEIGDNSNIGPYSYIGCSGQIKIGNNVMISPRVSIYAENHNHELTDVPMRDQGVTRTAVTIEDDCWIASNSVILAGVTVGKGAIVAAGSIVTKDVEPFTIVGGNPARIIRKRDQKI